MQWQSLLNDGRARYCVLAVKRLQAQPHQQSGALLIVMALILSVLLLGLWLGSINPSQWKHVRDQRTQQALAQAKQALLAYSAQRLNAELCQLNCPRPGDLPCPDLNNDGIAETACSSATRRLGRLPWKTIGLGELKDASGERLWYALSEGYRNNPRIVPLNLDTSGGISLRDASGLRFDATQGQGLAAVVIAPMSAITRADGFQQVRSSEQINQARAFLDIALGEDNAQFSDAKLGDNSGDGLVQVAQSARFNDVLLPISATEMHTMMQALVLAHLKQAVQDCGLACMSENWITPASVQDTSCLGATGIVNFGCQPSPIIISQATLKPEIFSEETIGRLPVFSASGLGAMVNFITGEARHHWFQQNAWREQTFIQVTPQTVTIFVAGEAQADQQRNSVAQKKQLAQYLELAPTSQKIANDSLWKYTLK